MKIFLILIISTLYGCIPYYPNYYTSHSYERGHTNYYYPPSYGYRYHNHNNWNHHYRND